MISHKLQVISDKKLENKQLNAMTHMSSVVETVSEPVNLSLVTYDL